MYICMLNRISFLSAMVLLFTAKVPINIVQATLGDEIKVPTLDGQVVMRVPGRNSAWKGTAFEGQRHSQFA